MSEPQDERPNGGLLIYQADAGTAPIRVLLEGESVWLTQKMLADLYQVGVNTVNHHIKGIFRDNELAPEATIRKYRIVQAEGGRQVERLVDHYNLDMIIAVGYRVRSTRGTQFRQWATARLSESRRVDKRSASTSGPVQAKPGSAVHGPRSLSGINSATKLPPWGPRLSSCKMREPTPRTCGLRTSARSASTTLAPRVSPAAI